MRIRRGFPPIPRGGRAAASLPTGGAAARALAVGVPYLRRANELLEMAARHLEGGRPETALACTTRAESTLEELAAELVLGVAIAPTYPVPSHVPEAIPPQP